MYRYIHINYPGSREKKGCHEKKLLPSRYTVAQPVAYKAGYNDTRRGEVGRGEARVMVG